MNFNEAVAWGELATVRGLLTPHEFEQYQSGALSKSLLGPIAERLAQISTRYVNHLPGSSFSSPIRDDFDALSYALYYTPINFAKVRAALAAIDPSFWRSGLRVLDFGSGPGTATLAARNINGASIDCTLVESSSRMRESAEELLSSLVKHGDDLSFQILSNFKNLGHSTFDLILAANVITELRDSEAKELLTAMVKMLDANGVIILLEPGQPAQTRRLMQLRDYVLEIDATLHTIFPCPHSKPCPMLTSSQTDWCHGTLRWERPRLVNALDELTGYNKHRIKYSCIVVQRSAAPNPGYRLLDYPKKDRRGLSVPVCGSDYFGPITASKGLPEEDYRDLRRAEQWDLVQISGMEKNGTLRDGSKVTT